MWKQEQRKHQSEDTATAGQVENHIVAASQAHCQAKAESQRHKQRTNAVLLVTRDRSATARPIRGAGVHQPILLALLLLRPESHRHMKRKRRVGRDAVERRQLEGQGVLAVMIMLGGRRHGGAERPVDRMEGHTRLSGWKAKKAQEGQDQREHGEGKDGRERHDKARAMAGRRRALTARGRRGRGKWVGRWKRSGEALNPRRRARGGVSRRTTGVAQQTRRRRPHLHVG